MPNQHIVDGVQDKPVLPQYKATCRSYTLQFLLEEPSAAKRNHIIIDKINTGGKPAYYIYTYGYIYKN